MTVLWPFDGLILTSADLTLRPVLEVDISSLAAILPDDFDLDPAFPPMPGIPAGEDRARRLAQSVWRHRGCWLIDDWALDFGVWRDGTPIGIQTLEGTRFPTERTVDSASWIAKSFRGKGFGIQARAAALAFAFDQLGAEHAVTSAVTTNHASLGVSRHLGYRDAGVRPHDTGDGVVDLQHLELTREDFVAYSADHSVAVDGFDSCRALFGVG